MTSPPPAGLKDFRRVKDAFRRALPPGHPLREQILSEPDWMDPLAIRERGIVYCCLLARMERWRP